MGKSGKDSYNVTRMAIPAHEASVIEQVAQKYQLNPDQRNLMYAIRKVENGKTGREFGVLVPEAQRYKDNPTLSFITQAKWAAGTIKKHYKDRTQLGEFAERWAPTQNATNDPNKLNANWVKNANYYLDLGEQYDPHTSSIAVHKANYSPLANAMGQGTQMVMNGGEVR